MAALKTKTNMVKSTLETIELVGNPNEIIGEHTLFYKKNIIVFINGKAKVSSDTASDLRKLGLVK